MTTATPPTPRDRSFRGRWRELVGKPPPSGQESHPPDPMAVLDALLELITDMRAHAPHELQVRARALLAVLGRIREEQQRRRRPWWHRARTKR